MKLESNFTLSQDLPNPALNNWVLMSSDLSWSAHIDAVANKAKKKKKPGVVHRTLGPSKLEAFSIRIRPFASYLICRSDQFSFLRTFIVSLLLLKACLTIFLTISECSTTSLGRSNGREQKRKNQERENLGLAQGIQHRLSLTFG